MNYKSQFGYLLNLLEITGVSFAKKMKIDRSLISKWKNNTRPLNPKSIHFNTVIETLIFFNHHRKDTLLERFFRDVYPEIDRNEPDYLTTCLKTWLQGIDLGQFHHAHIWQRSATALYTTNVEIFQGNLGKRHALIGFFEYALKLPPGQEIFISDLSDESDLKEDPQFYQTYLKKINDMAHYGHHIIMIFHHIEYDITRFSKYFTGKVTAYYMPKRDTVHPSFYIIHKQMLMLSIGTDPDKRYTAVHRDPFSIEQSVTMFMSRLNHATKLISTYSTHGISLKGFTNHLIHAISKGEKAYFISAYPPFSTMPESLLKEILISYDISDQQAVEMMQVHTVNKYLFKNHSSKIKLIEFISKEALLQALSTDKTRLNDLSSLLKQDVYITRKQVVIHLNHIIQHMLQTKNFQPLVISFKENEILNECMFWLVKEQMFYIYPLNEHSNFVISDALNLLDLISSTLDDMSEYSTTQSLNKFYQNNTY